MKEMSKKADWNELVSLMGQLAAHLVMSNKKNVYDVNYKKWKKEVNNFEVIIVNKRNKLTPTKDFYKLPQQLYNKLINIMNAKIFEEKEIQYNETDKEAAIIYVLKLARAMKGPSLNERIRQLYLTLLKDDLCGK